MIPQEQKLLNLLSNNDVTFFIPPYQRNYEWTEEQCRIFLNDVIETSNSNANDFTTEHFFGSITYFQTESTFGQPNKLVLIDGQQRITTTMLFLVALRDILDDKSMRDYVDSKYLKNNNVSGDSEYKIKLKQVETDWVAYKKIILSEELSVTEKNSAVYMNYNFFHDMLMEFKTEGKNLSEIINKGLNKFSVITIELQPDKNKWENPQDIFESMNSIGKPLSLADLVRNYLLLGLDADTQNELYNKYWLHIENTIPKKVSNFIRDYMQANQRKSYPKASDNNSKYLYSIFKTLFSEKDHTELLRELSEYSKVYSFVIFDKTTGDKHIDHELSDMRRLNVTTLSPFLMVLLRSWETEKISSKGITDILFALKIYCLRRKILPNLGPGENKAFPKLVNYIDELANADDKKQKMFEILSNQESKLKLPNDIELSQELEKANLYNFGYCRFILSLIEEKITKSRPDDEKLQIEHIMPQTLNDAWKEELGEDYEKVRLNPDLVHNIGNLTLIRHNQELGNKSFNEKKEIYTNNAGLQIAKTKIIDQDHWNVHAIKERQKWITEYLLKEVLPIPESMRHSNNFKDRTSSTFSFQEIGLVGLDIEFCDDKSIVAHVVNDKEVEFEGKKWRLSNLTKEIQTRRGKANNSGKYWGQNYWEYDGTRLSVL